jgi:hypothetical protein
MKENESNTIDFDMKENESNTIEMNKLSFIGKKMSEEILTEITASNPSPLARCSSLEFGPPPHENISVLEL